MTTQPVGAPRSPHGVRVPALERKILLALLLLLVGGVAVMLAPFWPWFVLALWTSSLARPTVERLTKLTRGRRGAAGLVTIGILVVIAIPLTTFAVLVGNEAYQLAKQALASPSTRAALVQLVSRTNEPPSPKEGLSSIDLKTTLELIEAHGMEAWSAASTLAGAVGELAIGVFVYFAATYAAMVHGRRAYSWVEAQLPIAPRRLRRFSDAFLETGRGLLVSVGLTGLVQAALSTIAFAALGVPRALALGLATFLASLIPSVGSALVWFPVSLGLLFAGHTTRALILFALGAGVVSSSDNVLRPLLARWGNLQLDPFLVLFSMLGGVLTIGAWGLILGPLLLRLALEAISLLRVLSRGEEGEAAKEGTRPARSVGPSG